MTTVDLYWDVYKRQARLVRKWHSRANELDAECYRWAARYDQAWADVEAARSEVKNLVDESWDLHIPLLPQDL